jgi:hypothetical protein
MRAASALFLGELATNHLQVGRTVTNFNNDLIKGIMGLSLPTNVSGLAFERDTFLNAIFVQGEIPEPVVGYSIDFTEISGYITFGGVDRARISAPPTWFPVAPYQETPVTSYFYWMSAMPTATVTGSSWGAVKGQPDVRVNMPANNFAVFDTGASLMVFPDAQAGAINSALGFTLQVPRGSRLGPILYYTKCDGSRGVPEQDFRTFTMQIGGRDVVIRPRDYVILEHFGYPGYNRSAGDPWWSTCYSAIAGYPAAVTASNPLYNFTILGNVFLKCVFSCYPGVGRMLVACPDADSHPILPCATAS